MKHFSILTHTLAITLMISACGVRVVSPTTPTINPIAQQVTVVAATFMAAAKTQAAIPTATQSVPTATVMQLPDFTLTALSLPTSDVTASPTSPTPTENPYAGDPCVNQVLPATLTGNKIKIRVDNPTKATINVSVYLQSGNPQGVCGYRGYTLPAGGSLVIGDLVEGCYSLWAWNPDPKNYFMVTNGTSCLDNSQIWTFDISPNSGIQLR
jgi:hypothetical protein